MNHYTQEQVRQHIVNLVAGSAQAKIAEQFDVSQSVLSLIVTNKRGISEEVAEKFGFRRHTVFSSEQALASAPPEETEH